MGCGVMCGDPILVSTSNKKSKIFFDEILQQLQKNDKYSKTQYFLSFKQCYIKHPQNFYLKYKQKLIQNQTFQHDILIKWKIVLYGQDKNNSCYAKCIGFQEIFSISNNMSQTGNLKGQNHIYFHKSFKQIQNDLDRTFNFSQSRKASFQKILKKITNHFPSMGYTQGINFMIGYLMIIGYSQQDCFWIFVHIALNRRFLLLGLYQDGFPLVEVLMKIFINVLKRQNQLIYNHLIVELGVDSSLWIFKWFITCFLYSFPRQLIKYIWDLIINIGNLGMISFAVALVKEIQSHLLEMIETADISIFFDSLRDINHFNQYINLKRVIDYAYSFSFKDNDFQSVENLGGTYGIIVKQTFIIKQTKIKMNNNEQNHGQTLVQYNKILNKWQQFLANNRSNDLIQQSNQLLVVPKHNPIQQQSHEQILQVQFNVQLPNSINKIYQNTLQHDKNNVQLQQNRMNYFVENINQNIQQEDNSIEEVVSINETQDAKPKYQNVINMDQLDKFKYQYSMNNGSNPVKINSYATIAQINKQIRNKKIENPTKNNYQGIKINNYAINSINSLTFAAQNLLKTQKNDISFDAISVSSKHASKKPKKTASINKQSSINYPPTNRICNCKQRTQYNKKQVQDQNSQLSQSKDRFSQKNSNIHTFSQHQNSIHQNQSVVNISTRQHKEVDYMVNSHGPQILEKKSSFQDLNLKKTQNQVQLQMITFKKDKRTNSKKNNMLHIQKNQNIQRNDLAWQNQQQSTDSIHHICFNNPKKVVNRSQTVDNYQIQSIK